MKLIKLTMATLGIGVIAMSSSIAQARTGVTIDIGLGIPLFRAPVYYSPPPVYYAPPRVVYSPRVSYPQPIYYSNGWESRGNGYGHGYGHGNGHGYGNGYGHGNGHGNGYGHRDDRNDNGYRDRNHNGQPDRWEGRGRDDRGGRR